MYVVDCGRWSARLSTDASTDYSFYNFNFISHVISHVIVNSVLSNSLLLCMLIVITILQPSTRQLTPILRPLGTTLLQVRMLCICAQNQKALTILHNHIDRSKQLF